MSIRKSLGLGLVVGLLAMAFAALPAIASAAPQLTAPAGTTVPVKSTISATSTNAKTVFPGLGTLVCSNVTIYGIVTKNNGTEVGVEMDSAAKDTATGCHLEGSTEPIVVEPTFEGITLTAASKTANFSFKAPALGLTETAKNAKVTYTSGATKIHVEGPVTGSVAGTFSGDFTGAVTKEPNGTVVNKPITFD